MNFLLNSLKRSSNLILQHDSHVAKRIFLKQNYSAYSPGVKQKPFREAKFLKKDGVSEEYQLIYRAPMENYLAAAKAITAITATLVSALVGYKYATDANFISTNDVITYQGLVSKDSDLKYFAAGFILVTVTLRLLVSKYPLRIYRNNDKYIAVFQGQLPLINSKINFMKGEVAEVPSNFLNPWKDSMYRLKNKNALLLIDYFKTSSELYTMLGIK